MSEQPESGPVKRGEVLAATLRKKMDALFGDGRKYEVVRQVVVGREDPRFVTPLGNTGYRGYYIRQIAGPPITDPRFENLDPRGFIFGARVVKQIHDLYDGIELPPELEDPS